MSSQRPWTTCLLFTLTIIFLAACRSPTPTPTTLPPPSPTAIPSSPTPTLAPPTPTQTPSPTPTPTPLPTWPDHWEQVGPSGGLIQVVAVDPTAPSTLYAGGAGGAVYKSEDGGETWRPGERLVPPDCLFSDLLVDATDTRTVYANACDGVYKSPDAGLTWSQASSGIVSATTRLVQSPHAPGLLLAGASNGQVYRSNDGATTWEATGDGLPGEPIRGLAISGPDTYWAMTLGRADSLPLYRFSAGRWSAIPWDSPLDTIRVHSVLADPTNPNVVFVSLTKMSSDQPPVGHLLRSTDGGLTWPLLDDENSMIPAHILGKGPSSGTLYAVTYGKLWSSSDEGLTWNEVVLSLSTRPHQFNQIAFDPTDDAVLYLALQAGVAKSEDGGRSWRMVNQGLNNTGIPLVAPHPTDPATLYAASDKGEGTFKSTDYGESWTRLDVGGDHRPATELVVDPNHPETLYLMSRTAHAWRSDDGGESWSVVWPDFRFSSVHTLISAPSEPNVLYASKDGLGLFRSDDGGNVWRPLPAGGNDAPALAVHPDDANFILSGDVRQSFETTATLRRSRDGGSTWEVVLGLPDATAITSVAFDPRVEPYFRYGRRPADPTRLYAASAGPRGALWFSNDAGDSWKSLNRDFNFTSVRALALSSRRPDVAYAGVWGGGTWRTDDGGGSWRRVPGDPATSPASVAVDPGNYNTVYIADGTAPRLYRSTDDGNTWELVFDAGPDYERLVALAIAPSDSSVVYVSALASESADSALGGALFRLDASAPEGVQVSDASSDLPGVPLSLAVHRYDSWRVFALPHNGGLYKTMDGGDSWRRVRSNLPEASFYQIVEDPFWPDILFLAGGSDLNPATLERAGLAPDEMHGVWRSDDGGNTWRKVGGATFGRDSGPVKAIAFPPDNQEVMYAAGEGGIYLSPDRGETWSNVTGRVPFAPMNVVATDGQTVYAGSAGGGLFAGTIHPLIHTANWTDESALSVPVAHVQLTLDPDDPQTLYASAYPGGVYKTMDGGMTWYERDSGLPSYAVADPARQGRYALAVAPSNAQVLYAGMHAHGVYRSDDGGGAWRPVYGDESQLRGANVEALLVHPDDADIVYAATDRGVWRTVNGGRSWAEFGPGTTAGSIGVHALALGSDGQLYAGTGGYGMYARSAFHQAGDDDWRQLTALEDEASYDQRTTLLVQPGDSNTLYAAAYPGGLYKTTDGGASWRELDVGLGSAGVLSLFAHPDEAQVLYGGTTGGLTRSADGGETWHLWNADWPEGQWVVSIAFDPTDSDVMYACSIGYWVPGSPERSGVGLDIGGMVMKSTDGGATWVEVTTGLDLGQGFYEVLADRFDPNVVYLATELEGVYLSRDGGAAWSSWNKELWNRAAGGAMDVLGFSADGRLVYFGTAGSGVWRRAAAGEP